MILTGSRSTNCIKPDGGPVRRQRGETASYQAIAAAIGQPKAVRAVANACANNRVALVFSVAVVLSLAVNIYATIAITRFEYWQ